MGSRLTRRRFLTGLGACAGYLALTNTMGCELLGRTSKLTKSKFYILYVNDGDTRDGAGGGSGFDWCYVDAEIEAANTCDRVDVR